MPPEPSEVHVAILIVGQNEKVTNRDIDMENHTGQSRRVDEIPPWYESLQNTILFPNADDGYNIYLRQVDPLTQLSLLTNRTVSAMNIYAYRIIVRDMNFNRILRATALFHQFLVDMYAKIETERLNFIKHNQGQLRAENYIHLKDSVDREGAQREARDVGKVVILPSSFTGGLRYMHERTQDAITCQES
jgi:hypothetical protein